jgi:hypothetical protein
VKNTWAIGTIVGQAIVTLVAISYGVSAHSSWETERQRRIDSERAAVAEMATAMKSAGERLGTVEQELARCQVRSRRAPRSPAAAGPTASETARTAPSAEPSTEEAFPLVTGAITWISQERP